LYNHNREVYDYIKYIETIKRHLIASVKHKHTLIHLTCMPPTDLAILKDLRAAGLDTISFDLECTDENYFRKYCPGKERTSGYKTIRKALRNAIGVFGADKVFSIVIAGIEPSDVFARGIESLIQDGVTPT